MANDFAFSLLCQLLLKSNQNRYSQHKLSKEFLSQEPKSSESQRQKKMFVKNLEPS